MSEMDAVLLFLFGGILVIEGIFVFALMIFALKRIFK